MKHSDFTTIAKVITPGIKQFVKAEVARAIAEQSQPPANNGALLDVLCEMFRDLNRELFDGALPRCLIKTHAGRRALGLFDQTKPSISIDRDLVEGDRTELAKVLLHEMCHLWRACQPPMTPTPALVALGLSAPVQHDAAFDGKLRGLGLEPDTHTILADSKFDRWLQQQEATEP